MRLIASLLCALILPPLGLYLAGGRRPVFWLVLGLFVGAQIIFWGWMAMPGLALWGLSIALALLAILILGLRAPRPAPELVQSAPWAMLGALGLLLVLGGCKEEAPDLDAEAVARGEKLIDNCTSCHSFKEGEISVGPSLAGIIDKPAGRSAEYDYSDALRGADLTWSPDQLTAFILDPDAVAPGTKMAMGGFTEQEASDIVTYLRSLD